MSINQLTNLRQAYEELERRVERALNTQVGDSERLAEAQSEVLLYSRAVEQVRRIHPIGTYNNIGPGCSILTCSHLRSSRTAGKMLCQ